MPRLATATQAPIPSGPPRAALLLREIPHPARRGTVPRDRLVRRLLATHSVRVVLIGAPAGFGKTTLLQAWARQDARPFHWLSPRRGRGRWSAELAALAAAPEQLAAPAVVVVDGLPAHCGADVLHQLTSIAEALPDGCLLVVAARAAAPLPVARLRAQHEVLELGTRDLAMTHGEALALLDEPGLRLGPAQRERLVALSEGWPAALSLLAQSTADAPDHAAPAAGLAADDPFLAEYVRHELLDGLPPDALRFLTRCSVLETLEAELCDAVSGEPGSAARLLDLERSELPIARVDRARRRWRCHPLLRAVLRDELRRGDPREEAVLHRRASDWHEQAGDVDVAIGHAIAGGALDRAGALMWRLAQGAAWNGRWPGAAAWLERIPVRELERRESLALSAAMGALSRLAIAEVAHWLTRSAGAPDAPADSGLERSLRAGRTALEAAIARSGVDAMRSSAARAAALAPEAEPVRALCGLLEGVGATLAGEAERATDALEDAARRAVVTAPVLAALCHAQLALMALADADWEDGATLAERARVRADAIGPDTHGSLALVVAVSAFARAHRGRFAEAHADIELARRMLAALDEVPPWYLAETSLALARAELRLSDVPAARELLASARRSARRLPDAVRLAAWIADAVAQADASAEGALDAAGALTVAELRVLRFLPSHLSFREIGERLHVSANTIKSQAHAVYRKLGASSRSVAVERARGLGLLDDVAAALSPGPGDAVAARRP